MNHVFRSPQEGNRIALGPNEIDVRLAAADTGGVFSLCEYVIAGEGPSPPIHVHERTDETFHVLEGRLLVHVEHEDVHLDPGATLFVRRGSKHTFANPSSDPVRFLILYTPGGFEGYFVEMGAFLTTLPPGPPDMDAVQAKAKELGERYDQVVPPAERP